MKNLLFLLNLPVPPGVLASCEEACLRLRPAGFFASVRCLDDREPFPSATPDVNPEDTLLLSDHPETLRALKDAGFAVIALQHEGNAALSFPGASFVFSEPEEIDADSYVKAWQRLKGLPWEILSTPRLRLRETTVEDVDALYEIYRMPGMTDHMEGLFPDPEDEKRYMGDYIRNVYGFLGFGVWSVLKKETGDLVGRCGFSMRNGFQYTELGFFIGTKWQRQGYAEEICRAALSFGKRELALDTVQALVREGNAVSCRLLERLSFHREKRVKAEEQIYGRVYPPADETGARKRGDAPAVFGTYDLYLLDLQSSPVY